MLALLVALTLTQWTSAALDSALAQRADALTWLPVLQREESTRGALAPRPRAKLEALAAEQLLGAVRARQFARARSLAEAALQTFGKQHAFGAAIATARSELDRPGYPQPELTPSEVEARWQLVLALTEPGEPLHEKARQRLLELAR